MLEVKNIDLHYGAAQALRGVSLTARARQGHLRAGPQRRRQDQPAARHRRPAADRRAAHRLGGQGISTAWRPTSAPLGIGYRAAGPRDLPAADGEGEPGDRLRAAAARRALRPDDDLRAVSGAERHAAPARRRSFRRPAAAARHRPRAGHMRPKLLVLDEPTEGIQPSIIKDIGRAIRYLRDRGASRSCWSSSISTSLPSRPTGPVTFAPSRRATSLDASQQRSSRILTYSLRPAPGSFSRRPAIRSGDISVPLMPGRC
jgi:urea transport system ATP-binding protein